MGFVEDRRREGVVAGIPERVLAPAVGMGDEDAERLAVSPAPQFRAAGEKQPEQDEAATDRKGQKRPLMPTVIVVPG